jgi:parvulin-like peptidyl-prolyl isomerase
MKSTTFMIILLFALAGCSGGKTVATVDGTKISSATLIEKMHMESGLYDPAILSDRENFGSFRRQALDSLITETVLLHEAKRLGLDKIDGKAGTAAVNIAGQPGLSDDKALKGMGIDPKKWQATQRRRALIRSLIVHEIIDKVPIPEEEISAYYAKHISEYRENAQFHAQQILVDKKETADRIRAELMKGADFGELAKKYSVSPDAARGGDLGFFDAQSYPETFAEICGKLSPGEISDVQATPYGYQIFLLIASRPARQRPLAEVRGSIMRKLQEKEVEQLFKPWLEELMGKAHISINEETLKEVTLNG